MGSSSSKLEKTLSEATSDEHYFGLENFGNTCYANSVLQALYFCKPFREKVLQYTQNIGRDAEEDLLTCLAELFQQIHTAKKKTGVIAPKKFVQRVKKDNELFRSYMHQDAHEFLNYLLNQCGEILEKQAKATGNAASSSKAQISSNGKTKPTKNDNSGGQNSSANPNGHQSLQDHASTQQPFKTFVHDIFEGKLVNETRCLQCENVTSREEIFMDLSLEIEQNSSLTSCLRAFRCAPHRHDTACMRYANQQHRNFPDCS